VTLKPNPFLKMYKKSDFEINYDFIFKNYSKGLLEKDTVKFANLETSKPQKMFFLMDNINKKSFEGLIYSEIDMVKNNGIENLDNNFENETEKKNKKNHITENQNQKKIFDENVFLIFRHGMRTPLLPEPLSKKNC
jgi:hypothetical protein